MTRVAEVTFSNGPQSPLLLIHGAGRMASRVLAVLPEFENYELAGLVSRSAAKEQSGNNWFPSLEDFDGLADLLIDFTLPGGTGSAAKWCARNKVALLSGTTGLSHEDIKELEIAALDVPVLWAPNLSFGVALISSLVRQTAAALGLSAGVSINDIHHQHKLDAPSGTALALEKAVMEGWTDCSPNPLINAADEVTFSSVREGEVIGEHTVSFVLPDEEIEITHRALSREVFARGALKAGEWLVQQVPGYYSTRDWLGQIRSE